MIVALVLSLFILHLSFFLHLGKAVLRDWVFHHEITPIYSDPLKPHFYIVKLGFRGVYIIFLISAQNIVGTR